MLKNSPCFSCISPQTKQLHEITIAILLISYTQVKNERSTLVRLEKHKVVDASNSTLVAPHRSPRPVVTAPTSPGSPSRSAARSPFPKCENNSSLASTAAASSSSSSSFDYDHDYGHGGGGGGNGRAIITPRLSKGRGANPVLEGEAQQLDALKRRRFMELQQMLAFELRVLAREASKRC